MPDSWPRGGVQAAPPHNLIDYIMSRKFLLLLVPAWRGEGQDEEWIRQCLPDEV